MNTKLTSRLIPNSSDNTNHSSISMITNIHNLDKMITQTLFTGEDTDTPANVFFMPTLEALLILVIISYLIYGYAD